jgi:hypothetical protein
MGSLKLTFLAGRSVISFELRYLKLGELPMLLFLRRGRGGGKMRVG